MPGVNPVVLIQLLMQYHNSYRREGAVLPNARTFVFNRNHRLIVHKETPEEVRRRRSILGFSTITQSETSIRNLLKKSLKGKVGKVWIDPKMKNIAVPMQMSTGEAGYGILPTGSRMDIPEGKFIRAFTYWERVNDIDLSCFAITEDGRQEEFSWRNMYDKQGEEITYSGDQTSGYHGGSEYFDVDIDLFRKKHPGYRYVVFCNNVYSGINFSQCDCKAGYMIRETDPKDVPAWKGERNHHTDVTFSQPVIFDPVTVQTSFRINAESTFAYLFAIDLDRRQMVWLNMARSDNMRVAGRSKMDLLLRYLTVTDVFNVGDLYSWAGVEVNNPDDAELIVSDRLPDERIDNIEVVHSWDFEKMLALLQPSG